MAKIIELGNIDTSQYVNVTEAQSVSGVKTFNNSPVVPTPSAATQSANKQYVDTTVDNKGETIKLAIPTALSELQNDTNFITALVDNLANYYKKSELYTQEEINTMLGQISSIRVTIITEFPKDPDGSTIYLKTKGKTEEENVYDEYMYINNKWEKIGDTTVDLSNYYTKPEIDAFVKTLTDGYKTYTDTAIGTEHAWVENNYVTNYSNEQIEGIKTFVSSPIVPSPSRDNEAANKAYVDAGVASFKIPEDLVYFDNKYSTDKVKVIVSENKPNDEDGYVTLWVDPNADSTSDDYVSTDELAEELKGYVKTSGNQTIQGTKTFSAQPHVPTPTNDASAANKGYVDEQINSNKPNIVGNLSGANIGADKIPSSQAVRNFIDNSTIPRARYFINPGGWSPSLTIPSIQSSSFVLVFGDYNVFSVIWKNSADYKSNTTTDYGSRKLSELYDIEYTNPSGDGYTAQITISSKDGSSHALAAICISASTYYTI